MSNACRLVLAGLLFGLASRGCVDRAVDPVTPRPDLKPPDASGSDQARPDLKPPDASGSDQARPDLKPRLDGCLPRCGGAVCGDGDGCGGTCQAGSGCYAAPGTWVRIQAGTFQMGSPPTELCRSSNETQHQVTLTRKFEIQATEVTQAQFTSLMGYSPSYFSSCGGTCPVEQVNWYQAAAYANALSATAGKAACYACAGSGPTVTCSEATAYSGQKIYACPGYRLPTEAEWEYAYRAGTSTALYNGRIVNCSSDANADKIAWYSYNSNYTTHPVGQKAPNAWGLYDLAGNVWEWCHDGYTSYPSSSVTDPVGTAVPLLVVRGGSWTFSAGSARAAERFFEMLNSRSYKLGIRLARSTP